jgi:hypothetical protein
MAQVTGFMVNPPEPGKRFVDGVLVPYDGRSINEHRREVWKNHHLFDLDEYPLLAKVVLTDGEDSDEEEGGSGGPKMFDV